MEPDPPPKKYDFKPREFKRDNKPGAAGPTAKELAMISDQRAAVAPKPVAGPKAADPNDVYGALREIRTTEQIRGLDQVEILKVKSRRKRDYWLLLVGGNLVFGAMGALGFLIGNLYFIASAGAGIVIFSLGLTWIMWQVMGRY